MEPQRKMNRGAKRRLMEQRRAIVPALRVYLVTPSSCSLFSRMSEKLQLVPSLPHHSLSKLQTFKAISGALMIYQLPTTTTSFPRQPLLRLSHLALPPQAHLGAFPPTVRNTSLQESPGSIPHPCW